MYQRVAKGENSSDLTIWAPPFFCLDSGGKCRQTLKRHGKRCLPPFFVCRAIYWYRLKTIIEGQDNTLCTVETTNTFIRKTKRTRLTKNTPGGKSGKTSSRPPRSRAKAHQCREGSECALRGRSHQEIHFREVAPNAGRG